MRILIAERNPHVRDLLGRELTTDGHEVVEAGDAAAVWQALCAAGALDAAVLDPDIPNVSGLALLDMFRQKRPAMPLVLHVYPAESAGFAPGGQLAAVVEKGGDLSGLKRALGEVLARRGGGQGEEGRQP